MTGRVSVTTSVKVAVTVLPGFVIVVGRTMTDDSVTVLVIGIAFGWVTTDTTVETVGTMRVVVTVPCACVIVVRTRDVCTMVLPPTTVVDS